MTDSARAGTEERQGQSASRPASSVASCGHVARCVQNQGQTQPLPGPCLATHFDLWTPGLVNLQVLAPGSGSARRGLGSCLWGSEMQRL